MEHLMSYNYDCVCFQADESSRVKEVEVMECVEHPVVTTASTTSLTSEVTGQQVVESLLKDIIESVVTGRQMMNT